MDTQPQPDPLAKLFINAEQSNREIAAFLVDYLRIDSNTLEVYFVDRNMIVRHKIPLYLLSMALMKRVGKRATETARAIEIARGIQADGNTVRPITKSLLESGVIEQTKRGEYFCRPIKIKVLRHLLEGNK